MTDHAKKKLQSSIKENTCNFGGAVFQNLKIKIVQMLSETFVIRKCSTTSYLKKALNNIK